MIGTKKKRHGTVEVADPDLGRPGVEVEGAPLTDFRRGVEAAYDFDADLGGLRKNLGILVEFAARRVGEPGDIDGLHAIGSGDRANGEGRTVSGGFGQPRNDQPQSPRVEYIRQREHYYPAMPITFDPVRDLGQKRISQDLGPAGKVEPCLRLEIRELDRDRHGRKIHQKMAKGTDSRTREKRLRWFALGCLAGVAGVWAVCASGLRINGTGSEPVGIYWAISKPPAKGDFVFALPPAGPLFKLALARGYLAAGPSPAGTCAVIKQVVAVGGDRVTISTEGVRVNGVLLKNSTPRPADDAGRPMRVYGLSDYTLGSDEVLLMSDYSPASFDGRYFGPLPKTTIQSVIAPILTWK
jgi:conjugative transfer signal peptidase TraF